MPRRCAPRSRAASHAPRAPRRRRCCARASPSTSGLTAFLAAMWLRGTESHSAAAFARSIESRAADIDVFAGRSSFGLTLEVPSAALEFGLDFFCEVLTEPAFDSAELERERA